MLEVFFLTYKNTEYSTHFSVLRETVGFLLITYMIITSGIGDLLLHYIALFQSRKLVKG